VFFRFHHQKGENLHIDWTLVATWAQAISSTIVLFMIYMQIKQANTQILQSDQHERFSRSWEFVKLYREELKPDDALLMHAKESFSALASDLDAGVFEQFVCHFFLPRYHLFVLLNQLVQHQEVDEKILFGYLEDDFNRFVEIGVTKYGASGFITGYGAKLRLLLTLWGTQIKSNRLLLGTPEYAKQPSS
jgi:hypothetical protein